MIDPLGNRTSRFVDGAGRLVSLTSPLGLLTRYAYDPLNRLTRLTDPQGGVTTFGYDPNGNLLSMTDARGNATSYTYNAMDRSRAGPTRCCRRRVTPTTAAAISRRSRIRKGQATNRTYDAVYRLTQVAYADGSTTSFIKRRAVRA